jgi:hypothetical protein
MYLFNDPVGTPYYTASNEWYSMFSEAVVVYFDVLSLYLPGGTEEKNLRQISSYLGWDMNPGPPNWKQESTKKNKHN